MNRYPVLSASINVKSIKNFHSGNTQNIPIQKISNAEMVIIYFFKE